MPKSASVLWAVADAGTQAIIADAHHAAVRDVLDLMERAAGSWLRGLSTSHANLDVPGHPGMS
jgi:hypothetical protein